MNFRHVVDDFRILSTHQAFARAQVDLTRQLLERGADVEGRLRKPHAAMWLWKGGTILAHACLFRAPVGIVTLCVGASPTRASELRLMPRGARFESRSQDPIGGTAPTGTAGKGG